MTEVTGQYIGQTLNGRYEIESLLGEGGFGLVFKAKQLSTGQSVAIKLMQPELLLRSATTSKAEVQIKRFQREMQLIAQLKHPNIVRLIDSGEMEDGQFFTVLEFIEGESLAEVLERDGPLSVREAKHLMFQVLDGLSSAHELGIVHRDLKPDNIMLTRTGYRRNAMVLDFGVATVVEELRSADYMSLTSVSEINGTPAYMAPEQVRQQKMTQQTDLYAWGLVMIECITGKLAVGCTSVIEAALRQASDEDIPVPPEIDHSGLRLIIQRAIAKSTQARYKSAREVLTDLDMCDISTWSIKHPPEGPDPMMGLTLPQGFQLNTKTQGGGQGEGLADQRDTQEHITAVQIAAHTQEHITSSDAFIETFDADSQNLPETAKAMLKRTVPQIDVRDVSPAEKQRVIIKPVSSPSLERQHQPTVAYIESVPTTQKRSQRLMVVWIAALAALIALMSLIFFRK
jgi:serine/threonine protein kinase